MRYGLIKAYSHMIHHICHTCQQLCGDFLSKINWVSGDGSSSYLSKGSFSITIGSQSTQENLTMGCAERGGWEQEMFPDV